MTAHGQLAGAPGYSRTQVGWWTLAALGAASAVSLVALAAASRAMSETPSFGTRLVLAVLPVILLITAVAFSTLTVSISGDTLAWRFGPGLVRFSLPLSEITNVVPTRTPLLAGIGIHWIGPGWVYNVSGRNAVEITRRDGKKVWIGSAEPAVLAAAIERARGLR